MRGKRQERWKKNDTELQRFRCIPTFIQSGNKRVSNDISITKRRIVWTDESVEKGIYEYTVEHS